MGRKKKESGWSDIDGGSAFVIPYTLLRHPNFTRLSPYGVKLLIDLGRQYTGFNNGYLCASYSLMREQGWHAPMTLHKAASECEHYQLIVKTQQGSLNKPNLYAFTWRRIDEKADKPLIVAPSTKPPDAWKKEQPDFVFTPRKRSRPHHNRKLKLAA